MLQLSGGYRGAGEAVWYNRLFQWASGFLDSRQKEAFCRTLTGWGDEFEKRLTAAGAARVTFESWVLSLEELGGILRTETGKTPGKKDPYGPDKDLSRLVENAGIVLLSPYLPRLFSLLGLTDGMDFKDRASRMRSVFLMQYLLTGDMSGTAAAGVHFECPEYEMELNKLLAAWPPSEALPGCMVIPPEEVKTLHSMLQGVLGNWPKLQNTSLQGFREAFLLRAGSLQEKEDSYQLLVEEKAYDMLLDTVPWSFRTIRYPWMEKAIQVKWR